MLIIENNNKTIINSLKNTPAIGDGNNFPIDPQDPTKWDTSIPRNSDGTPNIQAIIERIRLMLQYLTTGDPMSFNTLAALGEFMINLSNSQVWSQLSANDKLELNKFLNSNNILSNGTSLSTLISQAILEGYYYQNGCDPKKTEQFGAYIQDLINHFGGDAQECPWIADLTKSLEKEISLIPSFKNTSNFDDFSFELGLETENIFISPDRSDAMAAFFKQWKEEQIKEIMSKTSDPFLLYMMLLMMLFGQNNDDEMQMGGQGNLINTSSKYGQELNEAYSMFSKGSFTPDSAQHFYQLIQKFATHCSDQRFRSISPQIQTMYDAFFSLDPAKGISCPGNPKLTLGQCFKECMEKSPPDFSLLAENLNAMAPSSTGASTTPPQYTSALNDLQQGETSITSFSQVQSNSMQTLSGLVEKLQALLTAGLNSFVDVNKFISQQISTSK